MTAKRVTSRLDFGRAIETLREARGLSREDAAQLARISPSYLSEIERGLKRPSADIIARVARAFGMKTSGVMQFVEELSAPQTDDEASPRPVQLALKRGRALPLFSADDAPAAAPHRRGRRREAADADAADLTTSELLVIARRLNPQDRRALVVLARHLLSRGASAR
jgi:transcriptional regulator with XRE-family HTH domain